MDTSFDEFGNYKGLEYSESDDLGDDLGLEHDSQDEWEEAGSASDEKPAAVGSEFDAVLAHYGYDTQSISDPIIKPESRNVSRDVIPPSWEFHYALLKGGQGVLRSFAIIGEIGSGKSSIARMLGCEPDQSVLEKKRGITLQSSFHSVLVTGDRQKSFVFNIADTPGHTDFKDEVEAALSIVDGELEVVDAVEWTPGRRKITMPRVKRLTVVNKLDRLILDQRLPAEFTSKRLHALVNELGADPESIVFMSSKFQFSFTLASFSYLYRRYQGIDLDPAALWSNNNFVKFILDPIYKLISCGLIGASSSKVLESLGIVLESAEWKLEYDARIHLILRRFFDDEPLNPLVDFLVSMLPCPAEKQGGDQLTFAKHIECDQKLYSIYSVSRGTFRQNDIWIPLGAKRIPVTSVSWGSWIILPAADGEPWEDTSQAAVARVGVKPLRDTDEQIGKLVSGLSKIERTFGDLRISTMETGEYVICGTGELYLDCALWALRHIWGCEVRVSQPWVELREAVSEGSYVALPSYTLNKESSVTLLASPLPQVTDGKGGSLDYALKIPDSSTLDRSRHNILAESNGCVLSNEDCELFSSIDKDAKKAILDGFKQCTENGPLMEERMQGVHFQISELRVGSDFIQMAPTMRRACYAAALVARPILLEPWCLVRVIGSLAAGKAVYSELAKRGGAVLSDIPIAGTNLFVTEGHIAAMNSFGLEIDILCQLQRQNDARVAIEFCEWRIIPGDPLDGSKTTGRLQAADESAVARDYLLKTRRRKGLSREPQLRKYLDNDIATAILE